MKKMLLIIVLLLPGLLATSVDAQTFKYERVTYTCTLQIFGNDISQFGRQMTIIWDFGPAYTSGKSKEDLDKMVTKDIREYEEAYKKLGYTVRTNCECKIVGMKLSSWGIGLGGGGNGSSHYVSKSRMIYMEIGKAKEMDKTLQEEKEKTEQLIK